MNDRIVKSAEIIIKNFIYPHEDREPFHVLIRTLLSQRTKDENTDKAADILFLNYPDVFSLYKAEPEEIYEYVKSAGMYKQKSERIISISKILVEKYGGEVPSEIDKLVELPGIGRKTANIVLYVSFGIPAMAVDTHVHRISNRMGWIKTKTPEESEFELMKVVPEKYWGPLNGSMVKMGQTVCKPIRPECEKCILTEFCDYYSLNIL